jgi:hypothetical protein
MTDQHPDIFVKVQTFRDMLCIGDVSFGVLKIGDGAQSWIELPAGGLQMNSASRLALHFTHVQPFINGWYTGLATMTFDAYTVGQYRPFQVNARNSDAPTIAHFSPSSHPVGWGPALGLQQFIYSFSIQPSQDQWPVLTEESDEPVFASHVLDAHGVGWTKTVAGWVPTGDAYRGAEPIDWPELVGAAPGRGHGPLRLI